MPTLSSRRSLLAIAIGTLALLSVANTWVFAPRSAVEKSNRNVAGDESLPPRYRGVDWEARAAELLRAADSVEGYGESVSPMDALFLGDLEGKSYDYEQMEGRIYTIDFRPSAVEVGESQSIPSETQRGAFIGDRTQFIRRHDTLFFASEVARVLLEVSEPSDEGSVEQYATYAASGTPLGLIKVQLDEDGRLLSLSQQ